MNSKEKMEWLRAKVAEWRITKSMETAYDICTMLAENLKEGDNEA